MKDQTLASVVSLGMIAAMAAVLLSAACNDRAPAPVAPAPIAVAPVATEVVAPAPEPAAAPVAVASNAKAPAANAPGKAGQRKKSAKPAKVTAEEYYTLAADFYARHAACLRALVDYKAQRDIAAGRISDWGNIRDQPVCGYPYFDPATGRVRDYAEYAAEYAKR